MKKIISFTLVTAMLFCFASCKEKSPYEKITDDEISSNVEEGSFSEIMCYYSVNNSDKTDNSVAVSFPLDVYGEDDEFCENGKDTILLFYDKPGKIFYDEKTGEEIPEEELLEGAQLKVTYDGQIYSKNPVTIRPVKVVVCR